MTNVSQAGTELQGYKLVKVKDGRFFVYEMKLFIYEPTKEYSFLRRWYYEDSKKIPAWKSKGWNINQKIAFDKKFIQKTKIMNYEIVGF